MISISGKSMNPPAAISEGWELLTITDVEFEENPHQSIKYKVTLKVTSPKIAEVTESIKVDFPIWNRQNKDGTFGGEYDLARLVKATGINVSEDASGNSSFNYDDFRNKRFVGMIYRKPGGQYSEVYTGFVMSEADLENDDTVAIANENFGSYLNYLKNKAPKISAEAQSPQQSLFGPTANVQAPVIAGDVDDDGIPF